MYSNLLSSSFDILQLVLGLDSHILNFADQLINVGDFSLLCCFDTLGGNLCKQD